MVDWRPIVSGLVVFLVLLVVTLARDLDLLLLLLGFPSGFVAGYRSDGVLAGTLAGGLVGCVIAVLLFGAGYSLATGGPMAPGVGLALFAMALVAALLAAESTVAGGIGGFLSR